MAPLHTSMSQDNTGYVPFPLENLPLLMHFPKKNVIILFICVEGPVNKLFYSSNFRHIFVFVIF